MWQIQHKTSCKLIFRYSGKIISRETLIAIVKIIKPKITQCNLNKMYITYDDAPNKINPLSQNIHLANLTTHYALIIEYTN